MSQQHFSDRKSKKKSCCWPTDPTFFSRGTSNTAIFLGAFFEYFTKNIRIHMSFIGKKNIGIKQSVLVNFIVINACHSWYSKIFFVELAMRCSTKHEIIQRLWSGPSVILACLQLHCFHLSIYEFQIWIIKNNGSRWFESHLK